jgi:MoxR-like ATPase
LDEQEVRAAAGLLAAAIEQVERRVVGQHEMIEGLLMAIVCGGHVLLEGVPGLAKTLAIRTLAEVMDGVFRRIQFTPDLLPADLVGTMVFNQATGQFAPRKGPVFANIILADEINRAPAKVQSALLEAMQERQVTLGEATYPLDPPFFVLATQNPIEHEGTYPLPEAQLDRFMTKLLVRYPAFDEEVRIVRLVGTERPIPVQRALDRRALASVQRLAEQIHVDERIEEYVVRLVVATRPGPAGRGEGRAEARGESRSDLLRYIEYGASPRASIYAYRLARTRALLEGRPFVIPEDVKTVAPAVLRHRLILSYEAESERLDADDIVRELLARVAVP